jgi:DNA-directed RNA polymerase subunit N (RpoN/RPB10)
MFDVKNIRHTVFLLFQSSSVGTSFGYLWWINPPWCSWMIGGEVAPARSTRNVPLQHAVSQRKGFWYDQHIWVHLLADKKKTSAKVPGFGGAQKYICCRMFFSRSSKCICRNTRDFGMVDRYGCIYLKLKKASAKVLSFGGAQKYTCCRMLFSHSSKCIPLGS